MHSDVYYGGRTYPNSGILSSLCSTLLLFLFLFLFYLVSSLLSCIFSSNTSHFFHTPTHHLRILPLPPLLIRTLLTDFAMEIEMPPACEPPSYAPYPVMHTHAQARSKPPSTQLQLQLASSSSSGSSDSVGGGGGELNGAGQSACQSCPPSSSSGGSQPSRRCSYFCACSCSHFL